MTDPVLPPPATVEAPSTPVTPAPAPEKPAPARFSVADFLAHVSISQMSMALIVLVFAWQWVDSRITLNDMQTQLAQKIAEMDGSSKANQLLLNHSQEELRQLAGKVIALENHYAEAQSQRAALETLYNDLSSNRDDTALTEVEHLLMIAIQQLQLSANLKTALAALQSADDRLDRMKRANLEPLRKAIGRNIEQLRAAPDVDLSSLSYDLDRMIEGVNGLPLVYQPTRATKTAITTPKNTDSPIWQRLTQEIWQEVRQLIRVEDTGKPVIPLLPPEQEYFLRENLKLHLLNARLALLTRDETAFRQELRQIEQWSGRYFDTPRAETQAWLNMLKKLAASPLRVELPDLTPSLQLVRDYRQAREKAAR